MKTIGLIGGMSWESSIEYYRIVNTEIHARLGGVHSAKCVMYSFDFAEVEELQSQGNWAEATRRMVGAAKAVQSGGADFIVICTNTMHKMAEDVQRQVNIPLLHIADATAVKIKSEGLQKIGLLGTRFTMEEDFYKGRLVNQHGLDVLIPEPAERADVHRIIYDELVIGKINHASQDRYHQIIDHLVQRGAQGIILGCTEIGLLVKQEQYKIPLYDTTLIHAMAAVDASLA